ncbi:MAG: tRNA pseudouridine(38-40) synthase TruA [Prevotellaceae bacterium]|jgi:tRNA pseudouridine38-40 synthase|nr:tRNA pseudouridine(38-40) synthase TruA [Prevotellaceae bacterium]
MRYFINLSYNGKNYSGWQSQPNKITVQSVLENVLSTVLRTDIQAVGAGRTDAGVHSKMMFAHFDFAAEIADFEQLKRHLNSFLPRDIAIKEIFKVADEAHARFDAVKRTYEYWLVQEKNPFLTDFACYFSQKLDFEKMNIAAKILFDYQDFTSFSKLHTDVKTNDCAIFRADWEKRGNAWVFTISANRFLRNMVRAIVGTLLLVGENKISLENFRQIIEAKDRCKAGISVPACGLYLTKIEYE